MEQNCFSPATATSGVHHFGTWIHYRGPRLRASLLKSSPDRSVGHDGASATVVGNAQDPEAFVAVSSNARMVPGALVCPAMLIASGPVLLCYSHRP